MISLTPKTVLFILYSILLLTSGYLIKGKLHTCPIPEIRIDTVTVYETVIDPQVIPQFIEVVKTDTVITLQKDTVYKDIPLYIAQMDSVYRDSLLTVKVKYISPSPLDKRSYFSIDAKVREKIITETVTEQVTYNPDFFIEASGRVENTLSGTLGAGVYPISYRHLKSFIKAGAMYKEGWHAFAEIGARIEF